MRQKDERANLVFSMRVSGYSYAQIAQKAGISESSARVLEHRIRTWLKQQLEKGETNEENCEVIRDLLPLVQDGVASKRPAGWCRSIWRSAKHAGTFVFRAGKNAG